MTREQSGFEAVLLAAGASRRMGTSKALIDWCGLPLIAHQVTEFLATRVDRVVVVLGARAEDIQSRLLEALSARAQSRLEGRLEIAVNLSWESGKCSSIRTGVKKLSPEVEDIVLHSVDQPTTAEVLDSLFGFHRAAGKALTLPIRDGRRGHPVCVRSTLRTQLTELSEEELGLRGLIRSLESQSLVHEAQVAAPCVNWNINRPEDLDGLK